MKPAISKISVPSVSQRFQKCTVRPGAECSPSRRPSSKRGLRVRVLQSYRFRVPAKKQLVMLSMPEVSRWITYQRRLLMATTARNLIDRQKISLRAAALAMDIAPSMLCGWLQSLASDGPESLYPKSRWRASKATGGEPCRIDLIIA